MSARCTCSSCSGGAFCADGVRGAFCADGVRGVFEVGNDRCKRCGVEGWKHWLTCRGKP